MKRLMKYMMVGLLILPSCIKETPEELIAEYNVDVTEISAGEKVRFVESSTGNPVKWDWIFEGGNPETSQLNSPEVLYEKPGLYSVTLKVSRGESENVLVREQYIKVNYPSEIKADFKVDKVNITSDENVVLTDLSTGLPDSWEWTLISDDGIEVTSTLQNPEFSLEPGIYTITLKASSPVTSDVMVKESYITVIDANSVIAQFSTPDQVIVEGSSSRFIDESLGRVKGWEWSFEGATPSESSEQNPVVTYKSTGKYKVVLRAYNDKKESVMTRESYVTVLPSKDLIFYYPFEGDSRDYGPNNILVKERSAGVFTPVDFKAQSRKEGSYCAKFTRTDNDNYCFLELENRNELETGATAVTTSFWAKVSNKECDKFVVYQHGTNRDKDNKNSLSYFRLQNSKEYLFYAVTVSEQKGNWVKYLDHAMTDGEWHFYTAIYVDGDAFIYVDGKKVAESLGKTKKCLEGNPFFIGAQDVSKTNTEIVPQNFMDGCIDDIMLYNRAFTDAEVLELYNMVK